MQRPLFILPLLALASTAHGQQVLFSEGFESGQPAFTLNTTDVGSTAQGDNQWVVNDAYTGGQGSMTCMGFPFNYTVPNTPAQPAGITNANGNYLHIASTAALASGINNCNFAAADGLCINAANHFARMSTDVATIGLADVTLKFWWLCRGSNNSFGEVYYSTDAGSSWTLITEPVQKYRAQATWTQQSISLPEFAGQATLRFGFRFVNQQTVSANDPAFGIDDVLVTATAQDPNSLLTGSITPATYCPGSSLLVPYTASGPWGAGNTFTALLSDASGSFAAPTPIGSVASTFSGSVQAMIPMDTPLGTGYLVKVVASSPSMEGAVSVTALTMVAGPYAGAPIHGALCRNDGPRALLSFLPGASDCGAWTLDGVAVPDTIDPATAMAGAYVYTTDCGMGCPEDQATVTLEMIDPPHAGHDTTYVVCMDSGPFSLFDVLGGTPDAGGTWSGPGNGTFDPAIMDPGCFTYTVHGIPPCAADSGMVCVVVETCTGISDVTGAMAQPTWSGQQGTVHRIGWSGDKPLQVMVYEASGRAVQAEWTYRGTALQVALDAFPAGVYVVRIARPEGVTMVRMVHAN